MVDINVGNNNLFLPSQSQFESMQRDQVSTPEVLDGF